MLSLTVLQANWGRRTFPSFEKSDFSKKKKELTQRASPQTHRCPFQLVSQSVSSTASGGDEELITEFLSSHFEI